MKRQNVSPTKVLRVLGEELVKEFENLSSTARSRKIFFMHVPKCAGTTMQVYLQSNFLRRKIFTTQLLDGGKSVERFRNLPERDRYRYDLVKGHHAHHVLDCVHPDFLKLAILRDPVERILSIFYYIKQSKDHPLHAQIGGAEASLDDYLNSDLARNSGLVYVSVFSRLDRQGVRADLQGALDLALESALEQYDIVGLVEDFDAFVQSVYEAANLKRPYRSVKHNVGQLKESSRGREVSEETIARVRELCKFDMAIYDAVKRHNQLRREQPLKI